MILVKSILQMLALTVACLFVVISFWGGFAVRFPFGTVPFRWPLLWGMGALALGCGAYWMGRKSVPLTVDTPPAGLPLNDQRFLLRCMSVSLALLSIRFLYRVLRSVLTHGQEVDLMLIILVAVLLGAAYWGSREILRLLEHEAMGPWRWFPVLMWLLSPLAFPVAPEIAVLYVGLAGILHLQSRGRFYRIAWSWRYWGIVFGMAILIALCMSALGQGWAGRRLYHGLVSRLIQPAAMFWVMLGGLSLWRGRGSRQNAIYLWLALALIGMGMGGTRYVWGPSGVLLMMPACLLLVMKGTRLLEHRYNLLRVPLLMNLVSLYLIGILLGFIGENWGRSIHPTRPTEPEPQIMNIEDKER